MTAAKDFNKTRALFMERVGAPNVPPIAFKLAHLILYKYANRATGLSYPSQTTLAADLGTSIRTVQRLLDILERHGLVVVPGDGRGQSSRYWIHPQRVSPVTPFPGRKDDKKGRHPTPVKGDIALSPELNREPRASGESYGLPASLGERDALTRESDPPDRAGALDAPGRSENQEEESKQTGNEEESQPAAEAEPPSEARDLACRELLESWQRGWAADETAKALAVARNAFATACELAEPAAILAAAKAWIAAADAPRYLPPLPQWLAARGWQKPPPAKRRGRGRGGGRRDRRPRKPDMLSEFFEIARQKEAERAAREVAS